MEKKKTIPTTKTKAEKVEKEKEAKKAEQAERKNIFDKIKNLFFGKAEEPNERKLKKINVDKTKGKLEAKELPDLSCEDRIIAERNEKAVRNAEAIVCKALIQIKKNADNIIDKVWKGAEVAVEEYPKILDTDLVDNQKKVSNLKISVVNKLNDIEQVSKKMQDRLKKITKILLSKIGPQLVSFYPQLEKKLQQASFVSMPLYSDLETMNALECIYKNKKINKIKKELTNDTYGQKWKTTADIVDEAYGTQTDAIKHQSTIEKLQTADTSTKNYWTERIRKAFKNVDTLNDWLLFHQRRLNKMEPEAPKRDYEPVSYPETNGPLDRDLIEYIKQMKSLTSKEIDKNDPDQVGEYLATSTHLLIELEELLNELEKPDKNQENSSGNKSDNPKTKTEDKEQKTNGE